MNNKLKAFERMEMTTEVIVKYRDVEMVMPLIDLLAKVDDNGIGHILGSGGVYSIDSIKKIDGKVTVGIVSESAMSSQITSGSIVDQITGFIQKKSKGMSHIQITLGTVDIFGATVPNNHVGFVKIAENLAIRRGLFQIEDSIVFRNDKDSIRINKDNQYAASLEILSLCYGADDEQGTYAIENDLFMGMNKFNEYKFYIKQGNTLYNVEDHKERIDSIEGLRRYRAFGASPSNDRQQVIYFIDITNGVDRANHILDILTWGAYNIDFGKTVSYDKLAKLSSRWFQWMAPSSSLGLINCIAIYDGKFNDNRLDGQCYSSSEAQAKHIEEEHGYRINPRALDGIFWQGRPAQLKAGCINEPENTLKSMIYALDPDPIIVDWNEVTEQFKQNVYAGQYKGRVIIIGNGTIEFFVDRNVLKSDYDYSIMPEYTVLRFLKSNDSNFSSTVLQKMIAKNPSKAIEYIKNLTKGDIMDRTMRTFFDPKARVLNPDKFNENFYMDEIIQSIFPSYVTMDKNIGMNILDNLTKAANKILQKFKVPMTGKNSGITAGIEHMFNLDNFLGDHEVFCPAAEKMFKKADIDQADWRIFVIKYPSMDVDEYQIAKVVSRTELKARIKDADIPKELKAMFINYYCSLHDSVMVVPGCELFKNMLAGSDFDTDQVCWSMDKDLIEILDHDPVAIVIEG